jgi:Holliday junction resolvasome RuvABC endonuclease subunit
MSGVLGLDQSYTAFGWSYQSADGAHKTTKKTFPAKQFETDLHRLAAVRVFVSGLMNEYDLELVVMEGYANAAKFGREMAGELGAVVKMAVFDHTVFGSPFVPLVVPPTRLKKFVAGKGNAKKNEMLLAVYKRWGYEFADDNMADAFSLAKLGLAYLGKEDWELTQVQKDVLKDIKAGR